MIARETGKHWEGAGERESKRECVCVRERKREREEGGEREGGRETDRAGERERESEKERAHDCAHACHDHRDRGSKIEGEGRGGGGQDGPATL